MADIVGKLDRTDVTAGFGNAAKEYAEHITRGLAALGIEKIGSGSQYLDFLRGVPKEAFRFTGSFLEGAFHIPRDKFENDRLYWAHEAMLGGMSGAVYGAMDAQQRKDALIKMVEENIATDAAGDQVVDSAGRPKKWESFYYTPEMPGLVHAWYTDADEQRHPSCDLVEAKKLHFQDTHKTTYTTQGGKGGNNNQRQTARPWPEKFLPAKQVEDEGLQPCRCIRHQFENGAPKAEKTFWEKVEKDEGTRRKMVHLFDEAAVDIRNRNDANLRAIFEKWETLPHINMRQILVQHMDNVTPETVRETADKLIAAIDLIGKGAPTFASRVENFFIDMGSAFERGDWGFFKSFTPFGLKVLGVSGLILFTWVALFIGGLYQFFVSGWYYGEQTGWLGGLVLIFILTWVFPWFQGFVSWLGAPFRMVGRLVGQEATIGNPDWLRNIGQDVVTCVMVFGGLGMTLTWIGLPILRYMMAPGLMYIIAYSMIARKNGHEATLFEYALSNMKTLRRLALATLVMPFVIGSAWQLGILPNPNPRTTVTMVEIEMEKPAPAPAPAVGGTTPTPAAPEKSKGMMVHTRNTCGLPRLHDPSVVFDAADVQLGAVQTLPGGIVALTTDEVPVNLPGFAYEFEQHGGHYTLRARPSAPACIAYWLGATFYVDLKYPQYAQADSGSGDAAGGSDSSVSSTRTYLGVFHTPGWAILTMLGMGIVPLIVGASIRSNTPMARLLVPVLMIVGLGFFCAGGYAGLQGAAHVVMDASENVAKSVTVDDRVHHWLNDPAPTGAAAADPCSGLVGPPLKICRQGQRP